MGHFDEDLALAALLTFGFRQQSLRDKLVRDRSGGRIEVMPAGREPDEVALVVEAYSTAVIGIIDY